MLRNLIVRMPGRIPAQGIDLRALYSLRMPNGDYAPGRILETHRLWERRWNDGIPYVSTETEPSRTEYRVVGFLAVADRTVGAGRPGHLEALLEVPRLVLVDDPGEARQALITFHDEMSRIGPERRLGDLTIQPRTFMRDITVVDPHRIRSLAV
ncbi:hypothetical protein [Streptomyces benahoarensis]|uniref:Uncharacterized protein n=1 Tax=Streptomyces benahoarensis TaxID=2595054 RepID=A0A553ZMR2_9ACTN|nr:hypothetical protein [Streptomyces benahoarensis]TSB32011.1 hypothetical protein FNJ62_03790 [Streptomyces benahoarensis]TSB42737.1 hypothetical protein FNZ23_08335 [Streptomyces benahoarensis]